jgi:hypothetical protein
LVACNGNLKNVSDYRGAEIPGCAYAAAQEEREDGFDARTTILYV